MRRLGHLLIAAMAGLLFVLALPFWGLFLVVKFLSLDLWRALREALRGAGRRRRLEQTKRGQS
jgi:hypothetical protein